MLHAVATHLRINLQEAWSRFGLFGRHSYTTVLVMKILNISGIGNGQNPVLIGNAMQWSLVLLDVLKKMRKGKIILYCI